MDVKTQVISTHWQNYPLTGSVVTLRQWALHHGRDGLRDEWIASVSHFAFYLDTYVLSLFVCWLFFFGWFVCLCCVLKYPGFLPTPAFDSSTV